MSYQVIFFVDSANFGGIESHIIELAKLLTSHQIECSVLFYKDHNNQHFYKKLAANNIEFSFLTGSFAGTLRALYHMPHNTVIHTHGYKASIVGKLCCRFLRMTCVSTYHAGETGFGWVKWYNRLDKSLSFLSKNFAVSKLIAKQINKATVLDNFVVSKSVCRPIKINSTPIGVGFVGRLSYEKGPDHFIELASLLCHDKRFSWHVFGDGPMKASLPSFDFITYHGMTDSEKIWPQLDILVVTSRQEGLPMAILEAMANNVLVISTNVGAISSVVINEQTGYLVEQFSVRKFASIITDLPNNNHGKLTYLAAHHIQKHFSGKQQWYTLNTMYRNCLCAKPRFLPKS
ncbi:glycosyltransferase family 4 protein [Pseudoalteromonas sp. S16_S37]|uniref:glycosyltransferase family 4 protein n=1 Tax=Pseudoalteromonas sp. S16_S37 TaxID=2720228 RepID=UPI00168146E9|nr:glycosyltransferase family 4 protein [Pseudoalteromonas sp. S16_S37]MBD1582158.1 glycosyltransferase family 4 protein [Pseudoalteromonas sp. S16_S37]